jgi:hypothetical protein
MTNSTYTKRQRQRSRICRIEELETRDMLSVNPFAPLGDYGDDGADSQPNWVQTNTSNTEQTERGAAASNTIAAAAAPITITPFAEPTVTAPDPAKPASVKASTTTIDSITITWAANAKNASYTVTCSDKSVTAEQITVKGNSAVITGLNHSTKYTFTVTAKNADGKADITDKNGKNTAAATNITVSTQKYTAVKMNKSTAELGTVNLSWKAGQTGTTNYEVKVYSGNTEYKAAKVEVKGTTAKITGLNPTTKYTFEVKAVADTQKSAAAKVTVSTLKYTAVKMNKSTAELGAVNLSWKAGQAGTTGYDVKVYEGNSKTEYKAAKVEIKGTTATITGLNPTTKYTFTVVAKAEGIGDSAAAKVSVSTLKYTAVKMNKSAAGLNSVNLSWQAGLKGTTGYEVKVYEGNSKTEYKTATVTIKGMTAEITGLKSTTKYTFEVYAKMEGIGNSAAAKVSVSTVRYAGVSGLAGSSAKVNEVKLTWKESSVSETKGYLVEYHNPATKKVETQYVSGKGTLTATITGLNAKTKHTFTVYATTASDVNGALADNKSSCSVAAKKDVTTASATVAFTTFSGAKVGVTFADENNEHGYIDAWWKLTGGGINMSDLSDIAITFKVSGSGQYQDYDWETGKKQGPLLSGTFTGNGILTANSTFTLYLTNNAKRQGLPADYQMTNDPYVFKVTTLTNAGVLRFTDLDNMFFTTNTGTVVTNLTITQVTAKVGGSGTATVVWTGSTTISDRHPVV